MPFNVQLRGEEHDVETAINGVVIPSDVLADPRFDLLRWVDPYGDTVFNRAQCEALDAELGIAVREHGVAALDDVRLLAQRAANGVHLYLVFVGD
jgi:hypothetical protein